MSNSIEALDQRIRALEHVAAIKDLKARYLRGCDRQLPEEVRDCLVPENAIIAYEGFPEFRDRDSFVAMFREMGCRPGIFDMHHGANPEITLTGSDTASGKWALFFHNINLANRSIIQMGVEYDDLYVWSGGRWWIQETRTKRTSFMMQTIAEDGTVKAVAFGEAPGAFGEAPAPN